MHRCSDLSFVALLFVVDLDLVLVPSTRGVIVVTIVGASIVDLDYGEGPR